MARVRRLKQLRTYEVALDNAGLGPVAGVDVEEGKLSSIDGTVADVVVFRNVQQ